MRNLRSRKRGFGIEEDDQDKLLIDQLIEDKQTGQQSAMSLTDAVLASRKEKIDEINKAQEEAKKAEEEGFGDDSGDSSDDSDSSDGDNDDSGDGDGDDLDGDFDADFDMDDMGFDDPADESEDKDDKDKDEEEDEDLGLESVSSKLNSKWDFFRSMRRLSNQRKRLLQSYGIEDASDVQIDDPVADPIVDGTVNVVYAQDAMVEAIQKLGDVNKRYITNTNSFIEKMNVSVPKFDERISNFEVVIAGGQLSFTNKVISDIPLLKPISFDGVSDPRKTIKRLRTFLQDTNELTTLISSSDFNDMGAAFANKGFMAGSEVYVYKSQQPGFNTIEARLPSYSGYMKTGITEYQFYSITENNTSLLFNIPGLALNDEKELGFIIKSMKEVIIDMSLSVDILRAVLNNFNSYMDELKVLRVGIEDGEFENLAELGIDDKIKDFIKMKLIVEIISVNVNIAFDYLSGLAGILDLAVKFNDVE